MTAFAWLVVVAAAPADLPHWVADFYARPIIGVSIGVSGGRPVPVATAGAEGGVFYRYLSASGPHWGGLSRARGAYQLTGGGTGVDLRVGSFFGPRWPYVGISVGPDLFWNRWQIGDEALAPSVGVEVPLTVAGFVGPFQAWVGVAPAWLTNPDRKVDWSQTNVPGFGHEFAYTGGVALHFEEGFGGSLSYTYRITAVGPIQSIGVGADVSGLWR